jgi:large subunit ribosomal protein L16
LNSERFHFHIFKFSNFQIGFMLQPKRSKHRKAQKGRIRGVAKRGATISFGSFGLKALEPIWLTNRQIEAARQALTRAMKREGNVWIRVFPDKPITRKPLEVRMGKGKGNPEFWAAVVEPGRILFECDGVPVSVAKEAFELAAQKLPIKTKFIIRRDYQA